MPTRIYIERPTTAPSRALTRIADALETSVPALAQVTDDPEAADLTVLQVIGRQDAVTARATALRRQKRAYAVLQLVLRSTQRPSTAGWLNIWDGATAVWSYYDLQAAILADGFTLHAQELERKLYHAPLGADASIFRMPAAAEKTYWLGTTGASWMTESVREAHMAAWLGKAATWHLGPVHRRGLETLENVPDDVLAARYAATCYISGLRRLEGFELPAAEGLLCGARPILFDQPHYRRWYGDWAEYIPETPDRQGVIDGLVRLFEGSYRPVTSGERVAAAIRFNWGTLAAAFWKRCGV